MSINPPHPDTSHGEYITTPGFLGLPTSFPTRNTISLRNSASCCQSFRIWNSYITYLLSREKGHKLCFCYGISSTIIRGATLSKTIEIFAGVMNVQGVILTKTFFAKHSILYITSLRKGKHTNNLVPRLSLPCLPCR